MEFCRWDQVTKTCAIVGLVLIALLGARLYLPHLPHRPAPPSLAVPRPEPPPAAPQPDPAMVRQMQQVEAAGKALQAQVVALQAKLADTSDQAAVWRTIVTQQDTLLDVFSTALPDLPVYRQDVYVVVALPEAQFAFDSAKLSPLSQRKLELIARIFNRYDGTFYMGVEGHTDNVPVRRDGRYASNLDLGIQRATLAYRTMLQAGVPAQKMAVISWGDALPVIAHDRQQGDPANRRIELVFAPKRAIEQPEPVASLLTPAVRERLRLYTETFLKSQLRVTPVLQPAPVTETTLTAGR